MEKKTIKIELSFELAALPSKKYREEGVNYILSNLPDEIEEFKDDLREFINESYFAIEDGEGGWVDDAVPYNVEIKEVK